MQRGDETSTLVLRPDHRFQQEISRAGKVERVQGSWRRIGEGGIVFSKEFLRVAGVELFGVLITRKLLIPGTATTAKKAPLPDQLYVYCTKIPSALESYRQP
jgi:hypothetical protein